MRSVTYSMGVSLDGYIAGPDGDFGWTPPDEEVFRFVTDDEPAEGDIAIGGATLAAEAAALGLIDEYRARVYPVLVGGGIPFFAQREPPGRWRRAPSPRSLWIAAEDCPDGEQIEEADLDMLLAQLPVTLRVRDQRNRVATVGGNRAGNSGRVRVSAGQDHDGLQNRGRRGRGRVDDGPY